MNKFVVLFREAADETIEAHHIGPVAEGVIVFQTADGENIAFVSVAEIRAVVSEKHRKSS